LGSSFESLWIRTSIWEKTVIQDFYWGENPGKEIYISTPIFENKKIAGMLTLGVGIEKIEELLSGNGPKPAFGKTGDIFVVGRDYLIRSKSKYYHANFIKTKYHPGEVMKIFSHLLSNFTATDSNGNDIFVSASPLNIPFLNWALFVTISRNEALQSLADVRNSFLLILAFFVLSVHFSAYFFARKIYKPISSLTKAVKNIEEGDFKVNIKKKSNDEIEKERQRVARELHDGLGQALVALQLQLQQSIDADEKQRLFLIEKSIEKLDNSIEEIRTISNGLIPAVLREFGLSNALKNLCAELNKTSSINIVYKGKPIIKPLSVRITSYLYRITQEALSNVIKYSDAKNAIVKLEEKQGKIKLIISDDGKGFNREKIKYGFGIRNMIERVKIIEGKINIEPVMGKGVTISVEV